MESTKSQVKFKIPIIFAGCILLLALFLLHPGIRQVTIMMAAPVSGVRDFFVGNIQGDNKNPVERFIAVEIEARAFYFMRVEVAGEPQIHLDLLSPGTTYDNPEQEMVISAGTKKGNYSLLFNSGNTPASPILFRLHFLDDRPVVVRSIDLLRVPGWAYWAGKGLVCLIALMGLACIFYGMGSHHLRAGLLVFFLAAAVSYYFTNNPLESDNQNYGMVARSLLTESDIILNEFSARIAANKFYGIVQDHGGLYNLFPLGPSLLLAPLYALVSIDPNVHPEESEIQAGRLATALFFGGALALFFFLASTFAKDELKKTLLLTLIFGLCSHQFSQHLTRFWSHNAVLPFLLAALLALKPERREMAFAAGFILVLGTLMRPTAALLVPVVAGWLFWFRREAVGRFAGGCLVAGVLVAAMNLAFYGQFLSPYSQVGRLGFAHFGEGLLGDLFSPNRGLFVFMPWTFFSLWGIYLSCRRQGEPFFRLLALVVFFHLLLVASFPHWWGGHSYGPRLLVEIMPMLVLLLIPVFSSSFWRQRVIRFVFAATLVFSALGQIGGLTRAATAWNVYPSNVDFCPKRLWDWGDMQMLRPLSLDR